MSDPYLGEIRMFGGDYAPENWHFCDGTLLPISGYDALYSLIGTAYGGDGINNFALPDLRGRLPIGQGQGTDLTNHPVGEKNGTETVGLTLAQTPAHTHTVNAASGTGTQPSPENGVWASLAAVNQFITPAEVKSPSIIHDMNSAAIGTGYQAGGAAHLNMMPSFPLSFIIALQGEYPTRD
ncbi:phage tail protein [Geotalea uraniireducens]|nr:tail fiber protein [Geotalea uraniireducens]